MNYLKEKISNIICGLIWITVALLPVLQLVLLVWLIKLICS
jgi:hypothetical protein